MNFGSVKKSLRSLAMAAIVSVAGSGLAEAYTLTGGEVNISGATLFADFFKSPQSTADWIDVDGNGVSGFDGVDIQQLADDYPGTGSSYWGVHYRGVGSGNGLKELVNYGVDGTLPGDPASDLGIFNRFEFSSAGGGSATPPAGGTSVDIGVMDVPTTWFVQNGQTADAGWSNTPATSGYGKNPVKSWDTGQKNTLKTLEGASGSLNTNTASPDADTVFDTPIAWVPITVIANRGTGVDSATKSELQHHFTTGRMPNGENLVAAVRDSGSGTRNGGMSSLGIDPSFGRGDNLGTKLKSEGADPLNDAYTSLGPGHQASHLGGSSRMEGAVQNRGLAMGYTGLMGGSRSAADAAGGKYEIVDIDFENGNGAVRPSLDGVLNNDPTRPEGGSAWQMGGPETMATIGDPTATSGPAVMANQQAAAYINNIVQSISAFDGNPPEEEFFMPGEFLADNYVLLAGADALPDQTPGAVDPDNFVSNANLNQAIQDYILANNVLNVPAYGSVNDAGLVPNRVSLVGTGQSYGDGSVNGNYTDAGGNTLEAGTDLSARNRVMGDFNYTTGEKFKRNLNDIPQMMSAVQNPTAFEQNDNNGGDGYVCVEIVGDFTGDGDFDADDIRYFADGLAIDPSTGNLNRFKGFKAVDDNSNGNYFGTTIASGESYEAGDSAADVAGNAPAPGADPRGADGVIDGCDLYYVHAQSSQFGDGVANWDNLDEAIYFDLSADMDGDLDVDQADFDFVSNILVDGGTTLADLDYDGVANNDDALLLVNNAGMADPTYEDGDINCDGVIDDADVAFYNEFGLLGDADGNGSVNGLDIPNFKLALSNPDDFASATGLPADMVDVILDFDGNGAFNGLDIPGFKDALGGAAVPEPATVMLVLGGLAAAIRRRRS
jgi:hypothetical protein